MYQTGKSNSRNSALSVRSMTQVALFGAIIVLLGGIYPFSRIYSAWIYKGNHHPHPGHHRISSDGTEKGSGTWTCLWSDQLYK